VNEERCAMMLRPTAKTLKLLGLNQAGLADEPHDDDDWYLNLLWIERRKCLLMTHAGTLFSIFTVDVRLPQIRPIGSWALSAIRDALARERLPADCFGALGATEVMLGRAVDRRTLAFMNEIGWEARHAVEWEGGLTHCDGNDLNHHLRRLLHDRGGYVSAMDLVARRLAVSH
jgi:hypothetical protein